MVRPRVSTLILDLDNTLWDWLAIWHAFFATLLNALVDEGLDRETLLDESRAIHQHHRTSEYSPLLYELSSLRSLRNKGKRDKLRERAGRAAQQAREKALTLYDGVSDTLAQIRDAGTLVVAYTESMAFHTSQRIRKLGLDGVIQYLYSSLDHDFPKDAPPELMRRHPDEHYQLKETIHTHVERGTVKPSPDVLRQIIERVEADPEATAYVGDSLMKDVAMAQDAGVLDVWARYGDRRDAEEYELLRRVTHWTPEDVEREKHLHAGKDVNPTFVLEEGFPEILKLFDFVTSPHVLEGS